MQLFLFPVTDNTNWGYMDQSGKIRIPVQFYRSENFSEGLAASSTGKKQTGGWSLLGYISESGNWVIPESFAMASEFHNGLAIVSPGTVENDFLLLFYGIIDRQGSWIVEPKHGMIIEGDGFFRALDTIAFDSSAGKMVLGEGNLIYGKNGKLLTKERFMLVAAGPSPFIIAEDSAGHFRAFEGNRGLYSKKAYSSIGNFSEGFAVVTDIKSSKAGLINRNLEEVVPPSFEKLQPMKEGLAEAYQKGLWGFVDSTGTWVIPPQFYGVTSFNKGIAGVMNKEESYLMNRRGERVSSATFERIERSTNGLFPAVIGFDCGLIDSSGTFVLEPKFDEIFLFQNGLAAATRKRKWGLLEPRKGLITQIEYDFIYDLNDSAAVVSVELDGNKGLLNRFGEWIIPLTEDSALTFSAGEFKNGRLLIEKWVTGERFAAYSDRNGHLVIPFMPGKAWEFENGLAKVEIQDKIAYIDTSGNFVWKQTDFPENSFRP